MLEGRADLECHSQVAVIVHRYICSGFGEEVPGSNRATPPKVIENDPVGLLDPNQ